MINEKRKKGRPRIELTDAQRTELSEMSKRQCSDEEMAAKLGVCKRTLQNWKNQEWYQEIVENGRALGRMALRSAIYDAAVEQKNIGAMVWASKNILGWSDKVQAQHSGPNGGPMVLTMAVLDEISEGKPDSQAD